jgi:hypothetical protein
MRCAGNKSACPFPAHAGDTLCVTHRRIEKQGEDAQRIFEQIEKTLRSGGLIPLDLPEPEQTEIQVLAMYDAETHS